MARHHRDIGLFALASIVLHTAAFEAFLRPSRQRGLFFDPAPLTLSGETLEVEPGSQAVGDPDVTRATDPSEPAPSIEGPLPPRHSAAGSRVAQGAKEASQRATVFGAAGVRFATDLATTFTRAFPQAASADAVWLTAPLGRAGSADVTLVLDEAGHIVERSVAGPAGAALRRGIDRTLALITPRTFTAREPVTKLRVSARIARDDVHDGLHGEVFALSGGSFSGDVGTAFFALPAPGGGRRIDVELHLLR